MNVLMVGVDKTTVGGMLTVIENYLEDPAFCRQTNLKYASAVVRGNKLSKLAALFQNLPGIWRTIRREQIDIVHVHMAERGSVFREGFIVWMAKKMGCRTIIHMHGATVEDWYMRQARWVQKLTGKIFNTADLMLVLGENWVPFMERVMGPQNRKKIKVLYNGAAVEEENRYNPDAKNVLFYGMLIPRKGIEDLLAAFQMILDDIPDDVNLILYGDDGEKNIMEKIEKYGLRERAQYRGWLKLGERTRCFEETMIHVLPSYNEGLPMTVLETMGYGIPNISTPVAAIPEVIKDGENGRLVKPGDRKGLAAAMKELILCRELRTAFSRQAYQDVRETFSLQAHKENLIRIYRELLQ